MPDLHREARDTLLVLRYGMNFPIDAKAIETLLLRGYIEKIQGKRGWRVTASGRDCVNKMSKE